MSDTDDYELLRFLRARQFNVENAKKMVVEYKEWYKENKIASMLDKFPPKTEVLARLVPTAFFGFDKEGHPIYIERTGMINCEILMSQFTDNEIYMSHVWGQEHQIRRCAESCAKRGLPKGSIESFTTIMDLEGLTLGHRAALKFTQLITEADQKYYPERMAKTFVVNPPMLFSFFWKIVQLWLDPVTKSKVVFCSEGNPELFEYIDRDQVAKRYGGDADVPGLNDPDVEKLYAEFCQDDRKDESYNKEAVKAGAKFVTEIPMQANETYGWHFKSDDSIGFVGHFFEEGKEPSEENEKDARVVTAFSKVNSHKIPNHGEFSTLRPGTLRLVWDNTSSWFSTVNLMWITFEVKDTTGVLAAATTDSGPASPSAAAPDALSTSSVSGPGSPEYAPNVTDK